MCRIDALWGNTLTRAQVAIQPPSPCWGWGVKMTTPNSKTMMGRKARKKLSIDLNEYIQKCFCSFFFAQDIIEITSGPQSSNLAGCHIIFQEMCQYLRTYYR